MSRAACIAVLSFACSAPAAPDETLDRLPPLASAVLTTERTIVPAHALVDPPDERRPSSPDDRAAMLAEGYGEYREGGPWAYTTRTPGGSAPPAPGDAPKLLVRFVHLADVQLADDESPARVAATDDPYTFKNAFRPQEHAMCAVLDAAVRTIAALHAQQPLDLVLLGGDNVDNTQSNELEWLMAVLGGRPVECDSGADDDPAADRDAKDRFAPVGLPVAWYWVTGNHDVNVQGVIAQNDQSKARAIGDVATLGARDWRRPGGPITDGRVPADPRRVLLDRRAMMERVAADGAHGIGEEQITSGKAFYTFDVGEVRFVVLDTAAESGGAEGVLHRSDVDRFIRPALERARSDGKLVVLSAHHAAGALGDGTAFGGVRQEDAISYEEWTALIANHPHVRFSLAAHSHGHRVRWIETDDARGYWELRTAALADHPQQMRLIEIWDQDNGWIMLRATCVDFAADGDAVAEEARRLAILDRVSGWWWGGEGEPDERNVELWIDKSR
jgi:hypothetical protein